MNYRKYILIFLALIVGIAFFVVRKKMNDQKTSKNVFLNHIYTILDETTYDEIKKSDFLNNKFCQCQEQTCAGIDENDSGTNLSWTGLYLIGEHTFIELFGQQDQSKLQALQIGNIGLKFSVDREEDLEKILETFKQKFTTNVFDGLYKRTVDNEAVPFFYYVCEANMFPQIDLTIMAYHHDCLKKTGITQEEYNKKHEELFNRAPASARSTSLESLFYFDKNKLFKDIEEITLLVSNEIKNKLVEQLLLLGYTCQETEGCVICRGPSITFTLKSSENQACKLLILHMSLNYAVSGVQTYKLGISTITIEHKTATWVFN